VLPVRSSPQVLTPALLELWRSGRRAEELCILHDAAPALAAAGGGDGGILRSPHKAVLPARRSSFGAHP
jgi:hypothetical protein